MAVSVETRLYIRCPTDGAHIHAWRCMCSLRGIFCLSSPLDLHERDICSPFKEALPLYRYIFNRQRSIKAGVLKYIFFFFLWNRVSAVPVRCLTSILSWAYRVWCDVSLQQSVLWAVAENAVRGVRDVMCTLECLCPDLAPVLWSHSPPRGSMTASGFCTRHYEGFHGVSEADFWLTAYVMDHQWASWSSRADLC